MKGNKTLIFILTLILVMATTTVGVANIDYSQWNSTSKYPSDIAGTQLLTQARAYIDKGIITGDTDGLFHPERNITRAEYATIMAKATSNTGRISTAATGQAPRSRAILATLPVPEKRSRNAVPLMSPRMLKRA